MNSFWNERYSQEEYVYGENPNVFLAAQLSSLVPGKVVFPCEGEGRNAVYAAQEGWTVFAFDNSEAGQKKALQLADKKNVSIDYAIADALAITYEENSLDLVVFIYAHFPPSIRAVIHQKAMQWLKPGGKIVMEAFNPNQLNHHSGGPKELSMLYTEDMLAADFEGLQIERNKCLQIELSEGAFHKGLADVIQFVGTKR